MVKGKVKQRLHAYLSGRVQGVGMRDFVWRTANSLGLAGFVRNLPDGRVEVLAEGDPEVLEELLGQLQQPPVGQVTRVASTWEAAGGQYRGFNINY